MPFNVITPFANSSLDKIAKLKNVLAIMWYEQHPPFGLFITKVKSACQAKFIYQNF